MMGAEAQPLADASTGSWERVAAEAVGSVIEFWGFKRNQGRVWALLYLRGRPMSAGDLEKELGLSKGAISMLVRDLERWGVIHRTEAPEAVRHYRAETDLVRMVGRVVEERELRLLQSVKAQLSKAREMAQREGEAAADSRVRLERLLALASHAESAVRTFLRTAKLDVGGILGSLREGFIRRRRQ
jgi:DNA-binding transcriptional regulator GbsR (MarR family)